MTDKTEARHMSRSLPGRKLPAALLMFVALTVALPAVQVAGMPLPLRDGASATVVPQPEQAAAGGLQLAAGSSSVSIDVATLSSWVRRDASGALLFARAEIAESVRQLAARANRSPVDAALKFGEGGVVAVAGRDGLAVDVDAAVERIVGALSRRATGFSIDSVDLPMTSTSPRYSTARAESFAAQMVVIGQWMTHAKPAPGNGNGVNHRIPTETINGTVVYPGQTFDFWKVVGAQTKAKGYRLGGALKNGMHLDQGQVGGGVCAVATTMFNAALRAGLDIGSRRNHMFYFARYPLGLDATVTSPGGLNMTWTNDTANPILIKGKWSRRGIRFQLWSIPTGRNVEISKPTVANARYANYKWMEYSDTLLPGKIEQMDVATAGMDVTVVRVVTEGGRVIHRDTFRSHYTPLPEWQRIGVEPDDPNNGKRIKEPL